MPFQFTLELAVETRHLLQRFFFHVTQRLPVALQEIGNTQTLPYALASLDVAFVEDVPSEALDFAGNIPAFVVADAFVDVVQQPCQYGRGGGELFDKAVHGVAQHLVAVQLYLQIRT